MRLTTSHLLMLLHSMGHAGWPPLSRRLFIHGVNQILCRTINYFTTIGSCRDPHESSTLDQKQSHNSQPHTCDTKSPPQVWVIILSIQRSSWALTEPSTLIPLLDNERSPWNPIWAKNNHTNELATRS
jgi:hypothetical protein